MADLYEPQIEEDDDDGYSIPKILVAVLLLSLIGIGAYVYIQNEKVKAMFQTYEQQKKSIENELDQMELKYNLAIDDNGALSDELKAERDKIIRFRDSIKKIKGNENSRSIEEYSKELKKLREESTKLLNDSKNATTVPINESPNKSATEVVTNSPQNNQTSQQESPKTDVKEPAKTEIVTTSTNSGPQSFERVEIPPTYPGCNGDAAQKKACFNTQVKKVISGKFNADLLTSLNLPSGIQKVLVTFTIDKFGNVTNISASGPHPKMEAEAVKVTKTLPKMTPARQNGIPVDVTFKVPITFKLE